MACRMSRRVLDAINDSLLDGRGAYVEIIIGSVAKMRGYTLREWNSSIVGDLVPGPETKGDNVKLLTTWGWRWPQ